MSTRECISGSEEEEEMVRRVGGRGRSLVQAVLGIRREGAGRTPQNLQETQDNRMRPRQEVGPCGQEVERRLGGQTAFRERHRIRRVRARPSTPLPHPDFLMMLILLLWDAS